MSTIARIDEHTESVDAEMDQAELKSDDSVMRESKESDELDHPLFDDAVSEEEIKPEEAIRKFKQIIDEGQKLLSSLVTFIIDDSQCQQGTDTFHFMFDCLLISIQLIQLADGRV